jgi:hypothetical protein
VHGKQSREPLTDRGDRYPAKGPRSTEKARPTVEVADSYLSNVANGVDWGGSVGGNSWLIRT